MSTFLERILQTKQQEVQRLQQQPVVAVPRVSGRFAAAVTAGSRLAIISEVKKASPSKGLIQPDFDPVGTAHAYENAGASAVSVLTDESYFQGSIQDLEAVANSVAIPVLRKDFIIDELQIAQASACGADAVLLIVAALSDARLESLARYAKSLGLDVLVEVHTLAELEPALAADPSVLGINNRDLHTFQVSLQTTEDIMSYVPVGLPVISESGVRSVADAKRLADAGIDGLLVGETLMRPASHTDRQALLASIAVSRQSRRPKANQC